MPTQPPAGEPALPVAQEARPRRPATRTRAARRRAIPAARWPRASRAARRGTPPRRVRTSGPRPSFSARRPVPVNARVRPDSAPLRDRAGPVRLADRIPDTAPIAVPVRSWPGSRIRRRSTEKVRQHVSVEPRNAVGSRAAVTKVQPLSAHLSRTPARPPWNRTARFPAATRSGVDSMASYEASKPHPRCTIARLRSPSCR